MWRRMAHDEPTATDLVIFQLPPPAFPFHSFPVLSFVYPSGTNEVPCTAEVAQPVCLGEVEDPPNPYNDVNDKSRAHVKNLS